MSPSTVQLFLDELDAMQPEIAFWNTLDDHQSPFRMEGHPHRGEGGATTACYQNGQLVGTTIRMRDEYNRTLLICTDLRP